MKPKNELIPTIALRENFRQAMTQQGLTFKDLARRSGVPPATAYRLIAIKSPDYVTPQVMQLGRALGYTKKQIYEQVERDRLMRKKVFGKKAQLHRLIAELIELFDFKES